MCKLHWGRMRLERSRPHAGCPSLLFWSAFCCICTVSQTGHCIMENGFWCRSHLERDIITSRHVDENTYVPTYAVQIHKHGGTVLNARRGLYHVCSVLDNIIYTKAWCLLNSQRHPQRPARTRSATRYGVSEYRITTSKKPVGSLK